MAAARHLVVLSAVCAARGATPPVQLPEGFHSDPDGSAVATGWHHTCALRFTEGADIGGIAECWGHDVNGETKAPEDQARRRRHAKAPSTTGKKPQGVVAVLLQPHP